MTTATCAKDVPHWSFVWTKALSVDGWMFVCFASPFSLFTLLLCAVLLKLGNLDQFPMGTHRPRFPFSNYGEVPVAGPWSVALWGPAHPIPTPLLFVYFMLDESEWTFTDSFGLFGCVMCLDSEEWIRDASFGVPWYPNQTQRIAPHFRKQGFRLARASRRTQQQAGILRHRLSIRHYRHSVVWKASDITRFPGDSRLWTGFMGGRVNEWRDCSCHTLLFCPPWGSLKVLK